MTPSQLTDLIDATLPLNGMDERVDALSFRGSLGNVDVRERWLELRRAPPSFVSAVRIDAADSDEELEDDRVPGADETFQIRIVKQQADDELRLFYTSTWVANIDDNWDIANVRIADLPSDGAFATYRSRVETWTADPAAPFPVSPILPDPRAYTSDFSQRDLVPSDIRPWLLRTAPQSESDAFTGWRTLATRRLVASLADRVLVADGRPQYAFAGPPACAVDIPDADVIAYFDRAHAGANWIFAEGLRDADTRHLLLASEWARTFRKHGLDELGEGSLDSAKGAYNAYVKAGSRETLKALADLRKSVVDETQKISQRAQDLISAMWKDLAVASAPFVLKILSDAAKVENRWIGSGLAVAAAIFLTFSYIMQVYINWAWFDQQKTARQVWQAELNLVLSPNEVKTFSSTPIDASLESYRKVRMWVGMFYAVLVLLLLWFGYSNAASGTETKAATPAPAPQITAGSTAPRAVVFTDEASVPHGSRTGTARGGSKASSGKP